MTRRGILPLLCALAVLAPAGIPARAQTPQQLDQVEQQLEEARRKVEAAEEEREGLLAAIAGADERRDTLAGEIRDLRGDLAVARSRLGQIRAALGVARTEVARWSRTLGRTEGRLALQRDTLGERAAAAYMAGPAGLLEVVLGAQDLRSLADRVTFVRSVIGADNALVATIDATREVVLSHRERVAELEALLAEHRDRLRREVDRIEALHAERRALHAAVEEEIATREGLLEDVESERETWLQAVAELEAQSAAIAAQIQAGGSTGSGSPGATLLWPAPGPITSGFGWREHPILGEKRFHAGVDIDAECGDPIWAAESGSVLSAGYNGGYGLATVLDHGDGLSTLYAHQSDVSVSAGQEVARGQQIGSVGTTGWSTGCHLHFEVRVNGEPVDPAPYLG